MRHANWLVAATVCGLIGCGSEVASKAPSGDGGAKAGTPAGEPAKAATPKPEPKPEPKKATMGGDSPADVVKRMKAAVDAEDFGAVVNLIEPKERAGMVAMMALMPDLMGVMKEFIVGMAGGMGGMMGEGEDAAKAKAEAEAKVKEMSAGFDKLITDMKGVCKAHKVSLPSLQELGVNPMGGKMDPATLAEKVGNRLDHVDAGAFVTAMMKALERMSEFMPEGKGMGGGPFDAIKDKMAEGKLTDLVTTGDTATGKVDGEPSEFVKVGGRWYAKMEPKSGGAGDEPDMGGDEGDEDDGGEDG